MEFKTVAHLNRYLKQLMEADENLKNVGFSAEISNLKYHQSGHIYLTLKDEESRINAVMFSSYARRLRLKLIDGMKVRAVGSIGVYDRGGTYQVYLTELSQEGTGSLYQQFEALKKKLYEEGLFSDVHKKILPRYPKSIGVISAPSGAAIHDIITTLRRRWPFANLILIPSLVQGKEATENLVKALATADRMNLDVILLTRGGGSIEDLWCFNEERVARKIFEIKTPVISAIGHEIDVTIADYVSDMRAPTPTAAAEIAAPNYHDVLRQFQQYQIRFEQSFTNTMNRAREHWQRLQAVSQLNQPEMLYATKRFALDGLHQRLTNSKQTMIYQTEARLVNYETKLTRLFSSRFQTEEHRLNMQTGKLEAINPHQVMQRGYALIESGGKVVDSIKKVKENDQVLIKWHDGKAQARIIKKEDLLYDSSTH